MQVVTYITIRLFYETYFTLLNIIHISEDQSFKPTLHGGGPINFEASQLKQEGLFWFNLHTNLVTWVPTVALCI